MQDTETSLNISERCCSVKMVESDYSDGVELVIPKIMVEQSKSFQTDLKDLQALLKEGKLEEVILKNVLSIYHVLEILHKENKIDSQEFKQRTESLFNIVQLTKDVNANNLHTSKS